MSGFEKGTSHIRETLAKIFKPRKMIQQRLLFIFIIVSLVFSQEIMSQENLKLGVNETDIFYSENYTSPKKIEFVFSGNPKYINYFFSDLEKKLIKKFSKENIQISFRYSGEKIHYKSKHKNEDNETIFYLNIDNSTVIDEKNGSDRIMKFDFNGELKKKDSETIELNFKTTVISIHDITSENEAIINYLILKI